MDDKRTGESLTDMFKQEASSKDLNRLKANKTTGKPAIQQTSKLKKKLTAKERFGTVTYYIEEKTKRKIKILAAQQDIEISQLVREIFSDYLDRH